MEAVLAIEIAAGTNRDKAAMDYVRRRVANRLLRLGAEAVLNAPAGQRDAWCWWRFELQQMSEEERTAEMELWEAMRHPRDTEIRFTDAEEAQMAAAITAQARRHGI